MDDLRRQADVGNLKGIYLPGDKSPREWKPCAGCGEWGLIRQGREYCSRSCYFSTQQASESARQQMLAQWERQRAETGQANAGYGGLHMRVRKERGPAKNYPCAECGSPARDWSQVHDTDGTDPYAHYRPMCKRCHFAYDRVGKDYATATTHEERSARARLAWSRRTPEKRQEIARKVQETRRRNMHAAPPSD